MANGSELVLGFAPPDYARVREALGIRIPLADDEWEACRDDGPEEYLEKSAAKVQKLLREAHAECIATLGKVLGTSRDRYTVVETALGPREFSPFRVELHYDWSEMGEKPEHTTFGVSLSGRYFPTFVDWKDPHGTLWPVRFDKETLALVQVARDAIERRLPIFKDAHLAVIEKHY